MIYVDANVLYNYIFETELTKYSLKVLSLNEPKITSDTVVNEAIFAVLRKLAKEKHGITSPRKLKLAINKGSIPPELIGKAYSYVKATLIANKVILVPEQVLWEDVIALAEKYRLLPSDARILATALAHEADKLATLDRDFRHVDIVTLVPEDYWSEHND